MSASRQSCNFVTFLYFGFRYALTAFHLNHGIDQCDHCRFVLKSQWLIRGDASQLRNATDVSSCVIFRPWRPSRHNFRYGINAIATDIPSQDDKASADAVLHLNKLFKGFVGRVHNLSEPYVTDAYVQGIVVSYTPWKFG